MGKWVTHWMGWEDSWSDFWLAQGMWVKGRTLGSHSHPWEKWSAVLRGVGDGSGQDPWVLQSGE